jgi:biotin synthase-like enzyme
MSVQAGANSIFVGSRLFTTANPQIGDDETLSRNLGLTSIRGREWSAD